MIEKKITSSSLENPEKKEVVVTSLSEIKTHLKIQL